MKSANGKIKTMNVPVTQCYLSLISGIRPEHHYHCVNYLSKTIDFRPVILKNRTFRG